MRKNCSSDREKLLKLEAEGRECPKILRSLEQSIQIVKGQKNFGNKIPFFCFFRNGIMSPKLIRPTVRKNCSSDQENLLKFEAEVRVFATF